MSLRKCFQSIFFVFLLCIYVCACYFSATCADANTRAGTSSCRCYYVTIWQIVNSLCLWWSTNRSTRYDEFMNMRWIFT